MGFFSGLVEAVAGPLIGGLFGSESQEDTNAQNAAIARETNMFNADQADINRKFQRSMFGETTAFNAAESQKNRDFQERMSSTSWQRSVQDMEAAGLNPMLAYMKGGAPGAAGASGSVSTPAGSSASGVVARMGDRGAAAIQGAVAAAQVRNMMKQGDNIDADTEMKKAAAARELASAGQLEASKEKLITADIPHVRALITQVQADTTNKFAEYGLIEARELVSRLEAKVKAGEVDYIDAKTALTKVQETLGKLEIPERKAYAEKFSGEFGKEISPYLREVLEILRVLVFSGRR